MEMCLSRFGQLCRNGDLEKAKEWLRDHPDTDISEHNEGAFREACANGHLLVAKWLLSKNPMLDISASGYNPRNQYDAFERACINNHMEVAQWLWSMHSNEFITHRPFSVVCELGNLTMAKWLYEISTRCIERDWHCIFESVCRNGHLDMAKWIVQVMPTLLDDVNDAENGMSVRLSNALENAVWASCDENRVEVIDWLFQCRPRANIFQKMEFRFIDACCDGYLEMVQWIIQHIPNLSQRLEIAFGIDSHCDYMIQRGTPNSRGALIATHMRSVLPSNVSVNINEETGIMFIYSIRPPAERSAHHARNPYELSIVDTVTMLETPTDNVEEDNICSICKVTMVEVQSTVCKHSFCKECIRKWMECQPPTDDIELGMDLADMCATCPCCRAILSTFVALKWTKK